MDEVRNIVSANLVKIRKQRGLTQAELSEKINYSDNAISRWEKGEVLPSLETLQTLSGIYNLPMGWFLEEHADENARLFNSKRKALHFAIMSSAIMAIWTLLALVIVLLHGYTGKYNFLTFVWGAPITAQIVRLTVKQVFKNKLFLLTSSVCLWTLLGAIYFYWFSLNMWPLFFVGMPLQIMLVFIDLSKKLKLTKTKLNKDKKS